MTLEELRQALQQKRERAREGCRPETDPIELEWLASRIRTLEEILDLLCSPTASKSSALP